MIAADGDMMTIRNRGRLATALTVILLSTGLVGATSTSSAASQGLGRHAMGLYPGWNTATADNFETLVGRDAEALTLFIDKDTWSEASSSARGLGRLWADHPAMKVVSFPMSIGGQSLALGASGALDDQVRKIAQVLVDTGLDGSVIRVGWEHNGTWNTWSSHTDPDSYAAYFRRIVNVFRSVSPNFYFEWNVNVRYMAIDMRTYPGDAYVDVIGMDIYDSSYGATQRDEVDRWNTYLDRTTGLKWHRDFAAAHGKPMAYSEWGLTDNHLDGVNHDDPYFIMKMLEWIAVNDVAYATYFHSREFKLSNYPNAKSQYVASLGDVPAWSNGPVTVRPDPCRGASNPTRHPNADAASGYWILDDDGRVHAVGSAEHHGDLGGSGLPAVGIAAHPGGRGYWIVDELGRVFAFGQAAHHGDLATTALRAPIRAVMAAPHGRGYWLVGADGGVFAFGVGYHGSMGGVVLNAPVVSGAAAPDGNGYWLVGGDGGVFAFGAPFKGSTGDLRLDAPVLSLAAHPTGAGYWLYAADGGVFSFGVPFHGSLPGLGLCTTLTAVELIDTPTGNGYWILTNNGLVYGFGDAPELGDVATRLGGAHAIDMDVSG